MKPTESEELEPMASFFDARSDTYENHMEQNVADFASFYHSIASPISETGEALRILDIGCGTGLELEAILARAPNATVTGIDVSAGMLGKLRARYEACREQLELIQGSYLEVPLGDSIYDYAVAVMTLHHLLPSRKRELYRRVRGALKDKGAYVEGDWIVTPEEEQRHRRAYEEQVGALEAVQEGGYHVDIPLSLETQKSLLLQAGFTRVDVIWRSDTNAVYVARH